MTEEQHNFKKIEWVGDHVLRLAAAELCNDIIDNRYKATEIIDYLGSKKSQIPKEVHDNCGFPIRLSF